MTTPVYLAQGAATNINTSAAIPRPSVVAGDLMILIVQLQNSNETITATGWTQIDQWDANDTFQAEYRVYYKIAGASEPSTYTVSLAGSNHVGGAIILNYDGTTVDQTTPIATGSAHAVTSGASSTTIGCPSVVAPNNSTVVVVYADRSNQVNGTATPPTGFTNRANFRPSITALEVWADDKPFATGSTTGTLNATVSIAFAYAAFTFSINGVAGGATINTIGANLSQGCTVTGGAITITPPGTMNANGANLSQGATVTAGAVTVTPAAGTVLSDEFRNYSNILQTGVTVPYTTFLSMTGTHVLTLASQVTNGAGKLSISNAALAIGTSYMMATFDPADSNPDTMKRGFKKVTAA